MEQYIEGYYCRNDFELETLNKGSNRKIIEALLDAYPSGLTVKELARETGIPEKTVYPQIKSLSRERFIIEVGKEKQSRQRGRPSFKKDTEMAAQRFLRDMLLLRMQLGFLIHMKEKMEEVLHFLQAM